jgi:hypothetical protein
VKTGIVLGRTEWKDLRRRLGRLMAQCDHVPNEPPWPPGTPGRDVQELRKLLTVLDQRFEFGGTK